MKTLVASVATAAALTLLSPAAAVADPQHVTLGGVSVSLRPGTSQVVTVDHTHGFHAHLGFWTLQDGRWRRVYDVHDGRIGYGGLARPRHRVQGSGTTPLGTVRLITAFGRHARNDSGRIMRALDDGQSFVITRNGRPVGELRPLRRDRFVDAVTVVEVFRHAPAVDAASFREDLDRYVEQGVEPRA